MPRNFCLLITLFFCTCLGASGNKGDCIIEIKEGDNLWTISEKIYGDGYRAYDLWARRDPSTEARHPDLIFPGMTFKLDTCLDSSHRKIQASMDSLRAEVRRLTEGMKVQQQTSDEEPQSTKFGREFLLNIFSGIVSGLIASFVLVKFNSVFRVAKVRISPQIAYEKGDKKYVFKIVNFSRKDISTPEFSLTAFSPERVESEEMSKGTGHLVATKLKLDKLQISSLLGRRRFDDTHQNHFTIGIAEDLPAILHDEQAFITMTVTFIDPFNGTQRSEKQRFHKDSIVEGSFISGKMSIREG